MLKKIMVIEDDPDIMEVLEYILRSEGYEVITSVDGEECAHLAEILPDLILMDIRLKPPGQNGDMICLRLKSAAETKCFPVILLSAEHDLPAISRSCGADGYLSKPFDLAVLTDKVRHILTNRVPIKS